MRRLMIAFLSAVMVASALVGVAAAAPTEKNKNTELITVNCEGLGTLEVRTAEHAVTAFLEDGQVAVGKRFAETTEITVTTFDGLVFGPPSHSEEFGAKGKGFEGRLVECTFSGSFTDAFILDEGAAQFLNVPSEYIGTEVTLVGTFSGAAQVVIPGN